MSGGFQTSVKVQPAPGVEGDFASTNPRYTHIAGPGGLVAGEDGVTVARFGWIYPPVDPDGTSMIVKNTGMGIPAGLVHREQQGLITEYLANAGMTIPKGFAVTLFTGGDFWVKNAGSALAVPGMKAYANNADGQVTFGATASPSSASVTGSIGAMTTTFNGSLSGDILTVNTVPVGTIRPGGVLSGGTGMAANTTIVSQISGTVGGVGTYYVNPGSQTVAAATLTETYGLLTVESVVTGTVGVGGLVAGSGVSDSTYVRSTVSGTGATGTYVVNLTQTIATGTAMTIDTSVETGWYAMSTGLAGEIVKISHRVAGV